MIRPWEVHTTTGSSALYFAVWVLTSTAQEYKYILAAIDSFKWVEVVQVRDFTILTVGLHPNPYHTQI